MAKYNSLEELRAAKDSRYAAEKRNPHSAINTGRITKQNWSQVNPHTGYTERKSSYSTGTVQHPELDAAMGNTPDFVAPSTLSEKDYTTQKAELNKQLDALNQQYRTVWIDQGGDYSALTSQISDVEAKLRDLESRYASGKYSEVYGRMSEETKANTDKLGELLAEQRDITRRQGLVATPILGSFADSDPYRLAELNKEIAAIKQQLAAEGFSEEEIESLTNRSVQDYNAEQTKDMRNAAYNKATDRTGAGNLGVRIANDTVAGLSAIDLLVQNLTRGTDAITGQRELVDYNTEAQQFVHRSEAVTKAHNENIAENMAKKHGANTEEAARATNRRVFMNNILASMGTSGATIALTPIIGPAAAAMVQGSSAAAKTMHEYHNNGYSDGQALTMGLVAGAVETVTEKIGIDNLFALKGLGGLTGKVLLKQLGINTLKQGAVEGAEEGLSTVMNTVADLIVLGDENTLRRDVEALVAQGMSREEAEKQVMLSWVKELGSSVLGGFISGELFGVGGSLMSFANRTDAAVQEQAATEESSEPESPLIVQPQEQKTVPEQTETADSVLADALLGETKEEQGSNIDAIMDATARSETPVPEPGPVSGTVSSLESEVNSWVDKSINSKGGLSFQGLMAHMDEIRTEDNSAELNEVFNRFFESGQYGVDAENNVYRVNPEEHIDQRTLSQISARAVTAFQYQHPELHDYFVEAAEQMKADIKDSNKGMIGSTDVWDTATAEDDAAATGYRKFWGQKRQTTDPIAWLLDTCKMTYEQIDKALDNIIADKGQENYANAKKVEMALDDMLSNGFNSFGNIPVPANRQYIEAKAKIAGAESTEKAGVSVSVDPDSFEAYLEEHDWDIVDGRVTEEELRAEWEAKQAQTAPEANGIYGHSVGAATPAQGPPVPTQSHLTEQNVHIPDANKPDINIGTHERLGKDLREARARAGFVVDSDNNIINAEDVARDLIEAPIGSLGAVGVEQAELTVDILYQQNKPDLAKELQERVIAEETNAGQVLRTAQDHMADTPDGKVKSALQAVEKARSHKKNKQRVQEADASVDEIVAAVQKAVPNAASVSTDQTAYDLIRSIYQAFTSSDKLEGRNWVAQLADELTAKIEHGAAESTPKTKTVAQQMISDLVRLTKEAAPKAANPAANTKANTETFQNFLTNRAEYEQAVAWAQKRIAEDYADNPEMLAAFNSWIANAISLRKTVSGVMRENGVKIKDILLTSWENKSDVVNRLVNEVLEPLDLTDAQAQEAAQIIYSQFWAEVTSGSTAAIEKFLAKKTVGKSSKEAIQDMDNLEAFEREEYVGPVQEKIIDKIIQENKATIREILRESGTSKWLAVIQIAQNTLVDAGLTAQQTAAFAERIYDRLWSEIETQSRAESERYAKDTPKPKTEPKPASQLFAELANLGAFGHPDLMDAVYTKAARAVIKENSTYINSVLGENAADQDRAVQAIKDYVLSEANLDPNVLAQSEQILDLAIRNEIFERNARYLNNRFGKKGETTAAERVSNIDKFMELFNRGAFGKTTIKDAVYEHLGLPVLTAAETKRIYDLTALAKSVQSQDPRLAKEMMREANRIIAAKIPNTVMDRLNAWRYFAMLGNIRTHIRNIESTAAFMPVRMVKDAVGAGLETLVGKDVRTKSILNVFNKSDRALYQNAASDYEMVEDEIQNAGKYDERDDIERERQILPGIIGAASELNTKALNAEDRWFSKPAYVMALAGWLKANNITAEQFAKLRNNPTSPQLKAAREYAIKEAQKATYRDLNAFSELVSSRVNTKNEKVNTLVNAAVGAVVPFKRTPANIIVRATEYSPAYLVKGIWEMRTKVKSGDVTAAEALDHIASGLTGTALMGLGALLAHFDILTASADDDEEQAALNKLKGMQDYALNIGGVSYTIDWLAPESLMLFTGCEVYRIFEGLGNGESTYQDFVDAIMGLADPMLETSMLSGINDMLESLGYSDATIPALAGSVAVNYVSSFLPTIGGQLDRSMDSARQETYRYNESKILDSNGQHTLGNLLNKIPIPGVEYGQIDYVDAWGRTQEYDNPLLNALNQFVNPSYVSEDRTTVADQVIQDLLDHDQTGVVPERRSQSTTISVRNAEGDIVRKRHLTKEEYVQFNKISGQTSLDLVTRFASTPEYQAMDYATRADVVRDIYLYSDAVASMRVEPSSVFTGWRKNAMASSDPLSIILDRNSDTK